MINGYTLSFGAMSILIVVVFTEIANHLGG